MRAILHEPVENATDQSHTGRTCVLLLRRQAMLGGTHRVDLMHLRISQCLAIYGDIVKETVELWQIKVSQNLLE